MSKTFWAVIAAIVIIFGGVAIISTHKNSGSGSGSSVSGGSYHTEGNGSSGVTLVEYGDFQCPYCEEYYQTVKTVVAAYPQITFQFVNFPLTSIHQNAFAGARAAEAAAQQGKFWQMHDLLYENNDAVGQTGWISSTNPQTYFNQFAQQLGLNMTKFKSDYASEKVNNIITADMKKGDNLGVDGTPTFFVDGKQTTIANSVSAFQSVLNAAIKSKGSAKTNS